MRKNLPNEFAIILQQVFKGIGAVTHFNGRY